MKIFFKLNRKLKLGGDFVLRFDSKDMSQVINLDMEILMRGYVEEGREGLLEPKS